MTTALRTVTPPELGNTQSLYTTSQELFDLALEDGLNPVLATVHGSWLYGFAHEESDLDLYVVSETATKNTQKVVGGVDVTVLKLKTFVDTVMLGSHQAVEALFSPYAVVSPVYQKYLESLRPGRYYAYERMRHAALVFTDRKGATPKSMRHTLRLMGQAEAYRKTGYFDPSQGQSMVETGRSLAEYDEVLSAAAENAVK